MKIGIVIAIARELKAFLESDFEIETLQVGAKEVYKTKINNNELYAVKSGYGLIDASAATQFLITQYGCEIILNFGVTGALTRDLKVDDLFVVTKTVNHDYDVSPIDPVKLHQYEEFEDEFIPLDPGLIALAKSIRPDLKDAVDASGDSFIEKKEDKTYLASLGCNICDMEVAAIARTACMNNAKALSIKCISDTFDGDGGDFNTNVTKSATKAFNLLKDIIETL